MEMGAGDGGSGRLVLGAQRVTRRARRSVNEYPDEGAAAVSRQIKKRLRLVGGGNNRPAVTASADLFFALECRHL